MYDAIVVGLGGMGSSALFHLARHGARVLGIEQFHIAHERGSSHGLTRIIRLAYSEGSEYVPLMQAAYRYWRELESLSGESILHTFGGLDVGPEDSWTVRGSAESCRRHGLSHEILDAGEIGRRFPGYRLDSQMKGVFQPDGGYLLPELAIRSFAKEAERLGAEIRTGSPALGWTGSRAGISVATEDGRITAKRLVITAGPWLGTLIPRLSRWCRPERQVMLWTQPLQPNPFRPGQFPVFNMEAPEGRFYGVPYLADQGFKIGKYHHLGESVKVPDSVDRECSPRDESILREGIDRYFPLAAGPTLRMTTCMFTNTPDEDFILDRAPSDRRIFLAGGFSGHGFKFCSVVGRIAADFCLDRKPNWNLERFSLSRARMTSWQDQTL